MLDSAYLVIDCFQLDRPEISLYNIFNKSGRSGAIALFGGSKWHSKSFLNSINGRFFSLSNNGTFSGISKLDYNLEFIWQTPINEFAMSKMYFADTVSSGINLLMLNPDNSFIYYSLAGDGNQKFTAAPKINVHSQVYNIKSINDNFVFMYGTILDLSTNSNHAFLAKYDPINNLYQDTIFNGRTSIQKLVKISNKYYAAIGSSRGSQGYLILDTNMNQIKDIRVPGLYGSLKDIIVINNKVYLFSEKILTLLTGSLGANENYETDITVLSLPAEIIADVEENQVTASESITHSIYPNPATDYIEIQPSEGWQPSEGSAIQIFNTLGEIVLSVEQTSPSVQRIVVSKLTSGIYFIKIGNKVEKFVKM
jgi:hypothetical protein